MLRSRVSLTDKNVNRIEFEKYNSNGTNESSIDKMKHILYVVLYIIPLNCAFYYKNMKKYEIADMLSISPSTVSRHIKAAEKKLRGVSKYC